MRLSLKRRGGRTLGDGGNFLNGPVGGRRVAEGGRPGFRHAGREGRRRAEQLPSASSARHSMGQSMKAIGLTLCELRTLRNRILPGC